MSADDLVKQGTQETLDRWADLSGDHNPLRETHTVTSIRPRRPRLVA